MLAFLTLEIEVIKSIAFTPIYHAFIERLIGKIRREFLDHILSWNADDLTRKLGSMPCYYKNVARKTMSNAPGEAEQRCCSYTKTQGILYEA